MYPTGRPKVKAPIEPLREPTYATINSVILMLQYELPLPILRQQLLSRGLTEYQAFLAYKAAVLITSTPVDDTTGSFDPHDDTTPIG